MAAVIYDPVQQLRELKFYHLAEAVRANNEVTLCTRSGTFVVYHAGACLNVTTADDGTPRIAIGDPMSPRILLRPTEICKTLPGAIQEPGMPGLSWERLRIL